MSPAIVMTDSDVRRLQARAAAAVALSLMAAALWLPILAPAVADKPQAIPRALFQLGEYVCKKNDGLASVEAYPNRAETFGIRCADGAFWPDITARIRP